MYVTDGKVMGDGGVQTFMISGAATPKPILDGDPTKYKDGKAPGRSVHLDARDELLRWLCQGATPTIVGYIGETCFHALGAFGNRVTIGGDAAKTGDHNDACPTDFDFFPDH